MFCDRLDKCHLFNGKHNGMASIKILNKFTDPM